MPILKNIYGAIFKTPDYLGRRGEKAVVKKLRKLNFWGWRGKVLRNLYVPKGNGETTEVDLVYITRKGIFVLESKNYAGQIFGSEENRNWLSAICTGRTWLGRRKLEKRYFYNPVWQNRTHIRCLQRYLGMEVPMHSVVVFSQHCELRRISDLSSDVAVCQLRRLPGIIRKIWRRQWRSLSEAQVEKIYRELRPLTRSDLSVRREHIREVKRLDAGRKLATLWW